MFFYTRNQRFTQIVSLISGISLGFGFLLRLSILNGVYIPFQFFFLFFFALNGVFRAIIGLGLVLTGNGFWKQLILLGMQHMEKKGMQPPKIAPQQENPENNQNNQENYEKTKVDWAKWGAIGSILGGVGGIFSIGQFFNNASEIRDLQQQNENLRDKLKLEQYRVTLEKEYGEIQKMRAEQLQQDLDSKKEQNMK